MKKVTVLFLLSILLVGCSSDDDVSNLRDDLEGLDHDTSLAQDTLTYISFLDKVFIEGELDTTPPDIDFEEPENRSTIEHVLWEDTLGLFLLKTTFEKSTLELKGNIITEEEFKESVEDWKESYKEDREDYIRDIEDYINRVREAK